MNYLRSLFCLLFAPLLVLLSSFSLSAAPASITVDVSHPGHVISPTLYGIFFEDINCSADGGLYGELIRNRNFEDSDRAEHWSVISTSDAEVITQIDTNHPLGPKNPHALEVRIVKTGSGRAGVANDGFWGIPVLEGNAYELSFWARGEPGFKGPLVV